VTYNKPMKHSERCLALAIFVATAALFTGCGGSNRDQKATATYAHNVCTAIGSWLNEVRSLDTLPFRSGVTKASATTTLNHFQAATRRFVSHVRAVPPTASERREAREPIDYLVMRARAESSSANAIASLIAAAKSPIQMLEALVALPDYRGLRPLAQSTVSSLARGEGPLASAFKSEQACRQLR
jgi:hypothetical protein